MKRNKIFLSTFCIISVIIQIFHFRYSDIFFEYGFLIGINKTATYPSIGIALMYVLMPLLFIIFFNSGTLHNLTNGYGKLLIIRNYSKTRLFLKNYIKIIAASIVAVIVQLIIYYFCRNLFEPLSFDLIKSVIMYFVVLNLIFSVQCILELFVAPHIANIALFIYSFVSYYVVQITAESSVIMKILLFPSLLFGMQNGAVSGETTYNIYLMTMVLFNIMTVTIGILKFKKTDIF